MLNNSFKPIPGYSDYLVSPDGQIYSKKTNKLLKPRKDRYGYLNVVLCKNGKPKTLKVHRLVAMTFIQNPLNLPQTNHINGVKTDNRVENLEWVSASQNVRHAWANGLKENSRAASRKNGKITIKRAQEARVRHLTPELKELFDEIFIRKSKTKDISKKYNLSATHISNIKNKQRLQTAFHEYEKLYLFHTQK